MTGYTRKDTTNNIADGNIINADDLDNEFDGVQAAFHADTGHTHDGTAAEGSAITKIGPVQDVVVSTAAIYPKTTNTVDLGTSSLKYKDAFIAGNETVGGTLTVDGNVTLGNSTTDTVAVNGYMGVGGVATPGSEISVSGASLTQTSQYGVSVTTAFNAASTVKSASVLALPATTASVWTSPLLAGFYSADATKGAGSTITNQHGVYIADQTQGTNNYGISSAVSSGTNKWNIYASGTAQNYFAGNVGIGTTTPNLLGSGTALTVLGSTTNRGLVELGSTSVTAAGVFGQLSGYNGNLTLAAAIQFAGAGATDSGDTRFFTKPSGSAIEERMRIDSVGNVGVGTVSPATMLDLSANNTTITTDPLNILRFTDRDTSSAANQPCGRIEWYSGDTDSAGVKAYIQGQAHDATPDGNLVFATHSVAGGGIAERMRLDYAGNLGIGTTAPASLALHGALTVEGNSGAKIFLRSAGAPTRDGYVATSSGGVSLGAETVTTPILFSQSTSERMRIDSVGNVGIGTIAPATPLHVAATLSAGAIATVAFFAQDSGSNPTIGQGSRITLSANSNTDRAAAIQGVHESGTNAHYMAFLTSANGASPTEKMRITSAGNVGIGTGTAAPLAALNVNGTGGELLRISVTSDALVLQEPALGFAMGVTNVYPATKISALEFDVSDARASMLFYTRGVNTDSAPTEQMRLDYAGNLGLGITPSAWAGTAGNAMQINYLTIGQNIGFDVSVLTTNGYATGGSTYNYIGAASASQYQFGGGGHRWYNAPVGIANAAITFTQAMTLDANGSLGIGTTTPGAALDVTAGLIRRYQPSASASAAEGLRLEMAGSAAGSRGFYLSFYGPNGTGASRETARIAGLTEGGGLNSGGYLSFETVTGATGTNVERMRIDSVGNVQVQDGAIVVYAPAPAAISTTATLTNANIQAQIINTTGTTYTVTMALGTTLETLVSWASVNTGYDFTVINTASGTITMAANTGVTTLGALTIATGVSAGFRLRRTAANTFIMYRLR